jgi:hypothetical protein
MAAICRWLKAKVPCRLPLGVRPGDQLGGAKKASRKYGLSLAVFINPGPEISPGLNRPQSSVLAAAANKKDWIAAEACHHRISRE